MIKHLFISAIASTAVGACDPPSQPTPIERPAQTIYIPEDYNLPFDAQGGDTIILIMTPDAGWVDRCNDSGGEPIYNPFTNISTCDDVDF